MTRARSILLLAVVLGGAVPSNAAADVTAFWGLSSTPSNRAARGVALGLSFVVLGFEFEYANVSESATTLAPGLRTGMFNGMVQTPTRTQLYLSAGGGFYREALGEESETNVGTNIGGGIKLPLAGPLRLRLDYRIFSLRGNPLYKNPKRFYVAANFAF